MADRKRCCCNCGNCKRVYERTYIENYCAIVDNDCAYVVDLNDGDCGKCVFEFTHYGWKLALDLFLYLGCNAEEA